MRTKYNMRHDAKIPMWDFITFLTLGFMIVGVILCAGFVVFTHDFEALTKM